MKFLIMIYTDDTLLNELPPGEFDSMMRGCFAHADELRAAGCLLDSQQLDTPAKAKSLRVRNERVTIVDGPFTEAKECLGGFNLIEAENMDEAVRIASAFPWTRTGCIEIRPVLDLMDTRRRVGAV
ncbi:YciI family protein [Dyella tabacisoli]|uniref:YciI family protein n=1 Tax=Dyella tabacisoli TaxID=2282381 RepID=A0A369UT09_9GAMM|nr:YciI family protein [Dyella tabacisoli]RDD82750.1 YciI family protein [Dyella tabacisoli]